MMRGARARRSGRLGEHVVLLGVVQSAQARASLEVTAAGVGGVTGVTNFLLLPERR
jgi:osmotically-inducible protein OsmY